MTRRLNEIPQQPSLDIPQAERERAFNRRLICCWRLLALCLVFLNWAPAVAATLTATVDRNTVSLGESVTLSLVFEGGSPGGNPPLPEMKDLRVAPGISQRSEFTFVNGQQSSRQIYDYTLFPTRVGDVIIPPLQIRVGNQVLASQPLTLKVLPAGAGAGGAAASTNLAFLRLFVPKNEVFVGEVFPVTIQLFWQNARDIQRPQLRAEGFTLGQFAEPKQARAQMGGMIYNVAEFQLTATATKAGTYNLGPAESELTVLIPVSGRRARDPFDPFADFFGPQAQPRRMMLQSPAQVMKVLPLPTDNVPPGFNGTVGTFNLTVTAGPTTLTVGDPLTVNVRIAGNGRIEALTLPEQPQWKEFKSYPPTTTNEISDPLGLSGAKKFTQVLIPQNHEIPFLPPFQFSFFDPAARAYRTLTGPAIPLKISPTTGRAAPPPSLATNTTPAQAPPADDIVAIKTHPGRFSPLPVLLAQQTWFFGLQAVPVLAWVTLLLWRRRVEALANNPKLRRQREVEVKIRAGLKELHARAAARQSDEFFATLFRLLQEQLGERLDLPASAITEAVIDERLRDRGLAESTLAALQDLFQTCNAARYAPLQTAQEMEALVPRLETALRELRDWQP